MTMRRKLVIAALSLPMLTAARSALAHGDQKHAKKPNVAMNEQKPWGIAGAPKNVQRVIEVKLLDTMRFVPDSITLTQGETVRFALKNDGKIMHEMVIGTKKTLQEHAALMLKNPGMEHEESYMAHVAPGKRGEIVWTFNRAGEFMFACLIAGHYQAGMVGKIKVRAM
jgi:uncharacterized cupredoxin-like copper-binding protein